MPPSSGNFRGGTWQRYKLGQAQFTQWLQQTADRLTTTTTTNTRPTHSDKKAAKAGVDQLEAMAEVVVAKSHDAIPASILNILRDVIALRKKSFAFFSAGRAAASPDDDGVQQKDAAHAHIIKVLERVLAKFDAFMAKFPSAASKPSTPSSVRMNLSDLNNMFEHLTLHPSPDSGDDGSGADIENLPRTSPKKPASKSKPGAKKQPHKAAKRNKQLVTSNNAQDSSWIDNFHIDLDWQDEQDDDGLDYYLIIYCFFQDFNLIRSYICERWCDYYYHRSVPLDTPAVITNAAFGLFQSMEHDLEVQMLRMGIRDRRLASFETMMTAISDAGMPHVDYDVYDILPKEEVNDRIYKDEWTWLASPAFHTLKRILCVIPPGIVPVIAKSYRTKPIYGGVTPKELDKFKNAVVMNLVLDVLCIKALKKNHQAPAVFPAESELLLGFQHALRKYDSHSSALVYSLQLYVDIRYILEDTVAHPFEQLQQTAQRADASLPLLIDWASGPRLDLRTPLRQRQREVQRFML